MVVRLSCPTCHMAHSGVHCWKPLDGAQRALMEDPVGVLVYGGAQPQKASMATIDQLVELVANQQHQYVTSSPGHLRAVRRKAEEVEAAAEMRYRWLLHNLGTVNDWAKAWNPRSDGQLIAWLNKRIHDAMKADGVL